ncbi:MAG: riboflavin synthase subunit alpha [Proteobacteria bacterium]|nr:riboflavin synthase subunit alpha [Pseudomonadota bacterium]
MFTGIVQGIAHVTHIERKPGLSCVAVTFPPGATTAVEIGASVAIDGVCLTVTRIEGDTLSFDIMQESLSRSNLGTLSEGTRVNFERSLKFGQEIGGHLLSGHVDCTAKIEKIETPANNHHITFSVPSEKMRYIFLKGYVGLNGASLTVATCNKDNGTFTVCLIPETLRLTTFAEKRVGEFANVEIDRQTQVIVDTVTEYLRSTSHQ